VESLNGTLSNDPHLTDSELIEFSAEVIDGETAAQYASHLERCSMCASLAAMFAEQMAIWRVPAQIERLEARIGRPSIISEAPAPPWWKVALDWVSVATLRPSLSAMAAPADSEVIKFPVYEDQVITDGLSGMIQRRGQEYQIRITPSDQDKKEYQGRLVEIVLADLDSEQVLLERKIPIDRFVFLGTDLPIMTEKIAARLIT
jgi:hypothetical protein